MERKHRGQHGDDCFGCRVQQIYFSPSCFPSTPGGAHAARTNKAEKELSKDLAAFKRMTVAGNMPPHIDGATKVESVAESEYEIVSGQLAPQLAKGRDKDHGGAEWRRRAQEAFDCIKRGEVIDAAS